MDNFDVVVIGGGAAGLSAALVLTRARRRVLVVDGGAPRNAPATHMHGFLSRDGLPPHELLAIGRKEIEAYGGHIARDVVTDVESGCASGPTTSSTSRRRGGSQTVNAASSKLAQLSSSKVP